MDKSESRRNAVTRDRSKEVQIIKDECIIIPTLHREILSATRADIAGFENNLTFESPLVKYCYAK